jgi:hypothetical protein
MLDRVQLKEILDYDPQSGEFRWKKTQKRSSKKPGDLAGSLESDKQHRRIFLLGKEYRAHALAWFYVHGEWINDLDHVNRDGTDNRISNLRPANRLQQNANRKFAGVRKQGNKWQARVQINGQRKSLGLFDTKEQAEIAYRSTHTSIFKEFSPFFEVNNV